MNLSQSFLLALKGLATSKMRAFLTTLGIIIGVGAVIIIMSLGNGMQKTMVEAFESMGTNSITVTLTGRGSTRRVSTDQMYEMAEENKDLIKYISPTVTVPQANVKYGNTVYTPSITGVGEDYLGIKSWELSEGRFLHFIDIERRHPVCVVGSYYANEVFSGTAVGEKIKINGAIYTVIGVVDEIADSSDSNGSDNMVLLPYTNAAKLSKNADVSTYTFVALSEDAISRAQRVIETRLYRTYEDENAYRVMNMAEILGTLTDLTNQMILVLACIAGISLLVGGIGIMNIMLVSVTERTREIGIRKALGARRRDIRGQFIIEAGTTSALGGILGILFGITLASLVGNAFDIKAVPTFEAVFLSFGVSVGIGVIFGFLPANKAAKLNPIDALRYD